MFPSGFDDFDRMDFAHDLARAKANFAGLCNIYNERSEENGIELGERTDTDRLYMDFATALDEDNYAIANEKLDTLIDIMREVEFSENEFEICITQISDDMDSTLSGEEDDDDVEADEDTDLDYDDFDDDWDDPIE